MEPEKGFAYCLRLLKRLPPRTMLINQHVGPAFRFREKQMEQMLAWISTDNYLPKCEADFPERGP